MLGPGTRTGIAVRYDDPREVGPDRVANAVAARARHGAPCIVVDFGTSTNFDVVSPAGEYVGGVLAPGIEVSMDALFAPRRAALPRRVRRAADRDRARRRRRALQSGLVYGFAGQVDAIVGRIRDELGADAPTVATGGLAELIAPHAATLDRVDLELTLEGLRRVWELNQESPEAAFDVRPSASLGFPPAAKRAFAFSGAGREGPVKEVVLTMRDTKSSSRRSRCSRPTSRREVAERIRVAREFGDIAENAEYDDAKNEQMMLEHRIATLEERLRAARVIDEVGDHLRRRLDRRDRSAARRRRQQDVRVPDRRLRRGEPGREQALERVAGRQGDHRRARRARPSRWRPRAAR